MKLSALIIVTLFFSSLFNSAAEARIRLRKVKDAPKTCVVMKEDPLLSRKDKFVWGTERNSVVIGDSEITIVNDLGNKVCEWAKSDFSSLGTVEDFKFYIDEYKDVIYPFLDKKELGVLMLKVPMKTCSLTEQKTMAALELPKCEKPASSKKSKKKSKKIKA